MEKATKAKLIHSIPCRCSIKMSKVPFHNRALFAEHEVNKKINEYMQISPTNPFRILLQLNRLLTMFVEFKNPTYD